jgi:nitrogen fixation NifU-like protein
VSSDLVGMYQEVIIDHGRSPHNFRKPEDATRTAQGVNPLCGNALTVCLELTDGRINDVAFQGSRGAISQTSVSLMTTVLTGKGEEEALALFEDVHADPTAMSTWRASAHSPRSPLWRSSRCRSSAPRSHGTHFGVPSTAMAPPEAGSRHR